ncbi:MAG: LAGLIDADG family homing endonuclease, partial [Candidatus Micrarchaeota archaeon]
MKLNFLGACRQVGKSCVLAQLAEVRLLLDCGLRVHTEHLAPALQQHKFDACVLSHAHLDHSGATPLAAREGKGPVFATFPTIPITQLLLEDNEKVSLRNHRALPFKKQDVKRLHSKFFGLPYGLPYEFYDGTRFRFVDAGHIIGASQVLVEHKGKRLLYSGDLNGGETRMHAPAQSPEEEIDALIVESTYANREHPPRDELERRFVNEVQRCIDDDCVALLPCFAVGRTQEILQVLHANRLRGDVFLQGMGATVSEISLDFPSYVKNAGMLNAALARAKRIETREQRQRVVEKPCAIVATAGMCLHPDSFVHQANGVCHRIKDVDFKVYSASKGKIVEEKVSRRVVNPSPEKLVELRTSFSTIKCTSNHEFMVLDGLETRWKSAAELNAGDYVAVVKCIPFHGEEQELSGFVSVRRTLQAKKVRIPKKTNPRFSQFLGYFIGDGEIKAGKMVRVTDKDEKNLRFYSRLAKRVFGIDGAIEVGERKRLVFYAVRLAEFLKQIEREKSPKRRIPEFIQKSSEESVAAFLRGLFDAEGTVSVSTNRSVSVYSSSLDLIGVVQLLLLRFGVHAEHRVLRKRANGKTYEWRALRINKPEELIAFAKKIGFSSEAKKKKLARLLKLIGGGYSHADTLQVPCGELYEIIKKALKTEKLPWVFNRDYGLYSTSKRHCTKNLLEAVSRELSSMKVREAKNLAGEIRKLLKSKITFTKILEKKLVKTDSEQVFDLTVPSTSNYVANGLIVHNCDGGPVLSYLQALNKRGNGEVFLTGFQVPGTNGSLLAAGEKIWVNERSRREKIVLPVQQFDFSA